MSTSKQLKPTKSFRIRDTELLARFELLCKTFKLKEQEAFDAALRHWIKDNEQVLRLDNFMHVGPATFNIIQPQTVNIAIKAELTYCKLELSRILPLIAKGKEHEHYPDFLKQLTKIILQASRVQQAAQDPELGDLLTKAEAHLG